MLRFLFEFINNHPGMAVALPFAFFAAGFFVARRFPALLSGGSVTIPLPTATVVQPAVMPLGTAPYQSNASIPSGDHPAVDMLRAGINAGAAADVLPAVQKLLQAKS